MKTYIVEDSPVMVERITALLSEIPFVEIVGVSDSEEKAYAEISRLLPEFLILDIRLSQGDGINLLKKVKAEHPEIKVSMLTNYSTPEFFHKCMLSGADFFFDKAKDFEKIINAVNISRVS